MSNAWSFETRQIHAGQEPDSATGARSLPIYQTTSFVFPSAESAANRFALAELAPIYTRIGNPTQDAVEQRVASLEGGLAALLLSSGQAAETFAILNVAEAGDHVVASPSLYGGTYNLLAHTLKKFGISVTFVEDPDNLDAVARRRAAQHQAVLRRSGLQPAPGRAGHRGHLAGGARGRGPADRGQHALHAVPHPADRMGRGHRGALRHQVPRRPRHRDRGRDRGLRQLRLRQGPGAVPRLQHPGPHLQRPGLRPGPRQGRRPRRQPLLHPQGARPAAARPRLGGVPVQRLPHRPGPRDPEPARGAARRQRHQGGANGWRPGTTSNRSPTRGCRPAPGTSAAASTARRAPAPSSPSTSPGERRRASASSMPSNCTRTWRTSATCAPWSSTRRRPPTASSPRNSRPSPA